jgi:flagellin FlaB
MYNFHKNESGQTALETAIILIAFIVVASVFAFTILSAGSASTEQGEEAINAGLEGVQSTMQRTGSVIAKDDGAGTAVNEVIFNVSLAGGGDPIDLTDSSGNNVVTISYRDDTQYVPELAWSVAWLGDSAGPLLESGERAEITVDLPGSPTAVTLAEKTNFTLELQPPTGAVIPIDLNTPAALSAVMELR